MIIVHNQLKRVNKNQGVKISNARAGEGASTFTIFSSGGSPAKRAMRAETPRKKACGLTARENSVIVAIGGPNGN